jgi:hypothetical protein
MARQKQMVSKMARHKQMVSKMSGNPSECAHFGVNMKPILPSLYERKKLKLMNSR